MTARPLKISSSRGSVRKHRIQQPAQPVSCQNDEREGVSMACQLDRSMDDDAKGLHAADAPAANTKGHVGLPVKEILANISHRGANKVFVDYLQRTTSESQYLVGDADDADCAIVACSDAWLRRCGYGKQDVLGRGCRHLQGPETNPHALVDMAQSMARDGQCATSLVNYHADGTPFQNDFIMVPMTGTNGKVRYYMSVHCAEPALDWALAPPICPQSPDARVRSFALSPASQTRGLPKPLL